MSQRATLTFPRAILALLTLALGACALITSYDGGVPSGYGIGLQQHLLGL